MKVSLPNHWLPVVGILLALLLLAGAVAHTRNLLRGEFRAQLARRDADLLASLLHHRLGEAGQDGPDDTLTAVLETAGMTNLPGVMSVRFFHTNGLFTFATPALALDADLSPEDVGELAAARMVSRFRFAPNLDDEFLLPPPEPPTRAGFPVLEVILPLPASVGQPAGIVRFLMQADSLAAEYAALETTLRRQALWGFVLAGLAMTVALAFVFHRLAETQRRLVAANRELTLAAKTAAVGAVMSHLLHGLKSPLAGLQQFVRSQGGGSEPDTDWSDAAATTRRMRTMIDEVTRLLREDSGLVSYEISAREMLDHLQQRLAPLIRERQVHFHAECRSRRLLPNRVANMAMLILENIATNAVQATPAGGSVFLTAEPSDQGNLFRVRDEGPGIPERVRARLFTPTFSNKTDGTGLGLALSQQLARVLGAELELEKTGTNGSTFALRLSESKEAEFGMVAGADY